MYDVHKEPYTFTVGLLIYLLLSPQVLLNALREALVGYFALTAAESFQ